MAQLTLRNLCKDFGTGRPAVSDVTLDIRERGFLALLGPSGCGKTTVLRMIAGFEAPTDGAVLLGSRVLSDATAVVPPERRNMAMVFQSYALWPHMTVAENVGYPLKVRGSSGAAAQAKVREALASVRLESYADRRPADLSGGQRQRVALARCLVTSPDVVLLDEPLANLDRHLRQEMEEAFRDFHIRSGATIVYVTHDQAEAMALATDVGVMAEGRLLQVAPPDEIYARPEGRQVGALIGQGSILSLPDDGVNDRLFDRQRLETMIARHSVLNQPRMDVLVRPQDVALCAEGLPVRVASALFEGERYALRLELADGQALRAYARDKVQVGDRLHVAINRGWRL
ncbi:ABC transporter ATP-binding protein [Rhizobium sp. RU36D]|uniref:ABC transporter ATP-binding protein n=1 Tax=Rhizobium sp. RU36D TaxID=1907415 RepID=UPI0009D87B09|nr:ABC transporter ATP-binding protein [Rhizobium sp. RU36D]SMC56564.1 carbohydrate ABC transporter ATP-binding protein, CUT1 family [Rhizobium sp. RU36D]